MRFSKAGVSASGFAAGSPWTATQGTICGQSWSLLLRPKLQDKHTGKLGMPHLLPACAWGSLPRTTSLSLAAQVLWDPGRQDTWAPEPGDQNHTHC